MEKVAQINGYQLAQFAGLDREMKSTKRAIHRCS